MCDRLTYIDRKGIYRNTKKKKKKNRILKKNKFFFFELIYLNKTLNVFISRFVNYYKWWINTYAARGEITYLKEDTFVLLLLLFIFKLNVLL